MRDLKKQRRRYITVEYNEEVEPKGERYVQEVEGSKLTKRVKEEDNEHKHEKATEKSEVHDLLHSEDGSPNTGAAENRTDELANKKFLAACTKTYEDVLRARVSLSAATAAADNACKAADKAVRATLKMMIALKEVNGGISK
jgi:hypothetical protein